MAAPMPFDAPVTTATLPASLLDCVFIVFWIASSVSGLEESQEILVDPVLERGAHAVRCALVNFERGVLDEFGRKQGRVTDWDDLVVVSMKNQRRHVESLQIFGEIGFGKRLDAKVAGGESSHHALKPERFAHACRDLRARPVVAVKWQCQVLEELRAVGDDAGADLIEYHDGQSARIGR